MEAAANGAKLPTNTPLEMLTEKVSNEIHSDPKVEQFWTEHTNLHQIANQNYFLQSKKIICVTQS